MCLAAVRLPISTQWTPDPELPGRPHACPARISMHLTQIPGHERASSGQHVVAASLRTATGRLSNRLFKSILLSNMLTLVIESCTLGVGGSG